MKPILHFNEVDPTANRRVGGKAAGLARLVKAGLPVPPGFVVTTLVYEEFLADSGVSERLPQMLAGLDYTQVLQVEECCARIRELILTQPIPARVDELIQAAYCNLGPNAQVAVRSSGTAEDTAQASFAGLHDTYLNIRGADSIALAVRRCWASMWTARAVSYRQSAGFEHTSAQLAVVIQLMVESEVSGVMFTANPLNARTDEIVINSSWGLGEGLVSGILEPDEIILDVRTLAWRRERTGRKEVQVVRDPITMIGTVQQDVPAERRAMMSLNQSQTRALGELGQLATACHGGLPQDIEWAIAGGQVYLLQSRPITGVEFTWDEDVDAWQTVPENDETIWSGGWAAEFWSGPITPLFYSVRGREMWARNSRTYSLLRFEDLMQLRWTKYRRGTAFYNTEVDSRLYKYLLPKALRGGALGYHPPAMRDKIVSDPMDVGRFFKAMSSLYFLKPWLGVFRWESTLRTFMHDKVDHADFASRETLRTWPDAQVRTYANDKVKLAEEFLEYTALGAYVHAKPIISLLSLLLRSWYKAADAFTLQDLISGLHKPSRLSEEARELWHLAQVVRHSESLTRSFNDTPGSSFFPAVEHTEEGRAFLAKYQTFVERHGHNGHSYRDIYFSRRIEDPSLDYESIKALLKATDTAPPEEHEARLVRKREDTMARVLAGIRSESFGSIKATAFKLVHNWVMNFLLLRDDWRHSVNRVTLAKKWAFRELGLRAFECGLLLSERDFYFLAEQELYEMLDGKALMPLVHAKVQARSKVFDRFLAHQESPPAFLQGSREVDLEQPQTGGSADALRGVSISRGNVRGVARVVADLKNIGRIGPGDILVCNSTDPAWAPVFPLIGGLIMETGGMLSHGACLSREYSLAAVQLRNAMQRITDGAMVEVNGESGEIILLNPAPAVESAMSTPD